MQIEERKEEETRRKIYGRRMTVEEVLKEVRKDSSFYFHSGGGMTLSGRASVAAVLFQMPAAADRKRRNRYCG